MIYRLIDEAVKDHLLHAQFLPNEKRHESACNLVKKTTKMRTKRQIVLQQKKRYSIF